MTTEMNRCLYFWFSGDVIAVGGSGSTKKHGATQSTGEPLPALQACGY